MRRRARGQEVNQNRALAVSQTGDVPMQLRCCLTRKARGIMLMFSLTATRRAFHDMSDALPDVYYWYGFMAMMPCDDGIFGWRQL